MNDDTTAALIFRAISPEKFGAILDWLSAGGFVADDLMVEVEGALITTIGPQPQPPNHTRN